MVERQPEKLKVVGSNPIPDKMLFLLYFILFLTLGTFNVFIFDFTPISFLFLISFLGFFLKNTSFYVSSFNYKYFFTNIFLQISLFGLHFVDLCTKYKLIHLNRLKWKPLFKKSSYFGIYRSTRNQFLNK